MSAAHAVVVAAQAIVAHRKCAACGKLFIKVRVDWGHAVQWLWPTRCDMDGAKLVRP